VSQRLLEEAHPALLIGGLLHLLLLVQVRRAERFEGFERPIEPDDRVGQFLALFVRDIGLFETLVALAALAAEVALCGLDPVALARGDRLPAFDLEDERPEVDRLPLHVDLLGDGRAHRRALPTDAFEQLLALVSLHTRAWGPDREKSTRPDVGRAVEQAQSL